MELDFQTDLDGALEYITHELPSVDTDHDSVLIFYNVFRKTLDYYGCSESAQLALHNAMFNGYRCRQEAMSDFSVSRYPRGVLPKEYLELVDRFGLFNYALASLYCLPPKESIETMQELMQTDPKRAATFYECYLRIARVIRDDHEQKCALDFLYLDPLQNVQDTSQQLAIIAVIQDELEAPFSETDTLERINRLLQTMLALLPSTAAISSALHPVVRQRLRILYEKAITLLENQSKKSTEFTDTLTCISKMLTEETKNGAFGSVKSNDDMKKRQTQDALLPTAGGESILPPATKKRRIHLGNAKDFVTPPLSLSESLSTLRKTGSMSSQDLHREAFVLICEQIRLCAPPAPSFEQQEALTRSIPENEAAHILSENVHDLLIQDIPSAVDDDHDAYNVRLAECKKWCVSALQRRIQGWKSVLKVMVQYPDLWIREWTAPYATKTFSHLILSERLMEDYAQYFYRLRNASKSEFNSEIFKNVLSYFYTLLTMMEDQNEILPFRDYVYKLWFNTGRNLSEFASLRSLPVNVAVELTKTCNQIVNSQTNDGDSDTANENTVTWDSTIHNLAILSVFSPLSVVQALTNQGFHYKEQQRTIVSTLRQLGSLCRLPSFDSDGATVPLLVKVLSDCTAPEKVDNIKSITDRFASFVALCVQNSDYAGCPPLLYPVSANNSLGQGLLDLEQYLARILVPQLSSLPNDDSLNDGGNRVACMQMHLGLETLNKLCSAGDNSNPDWITSVRQLVHPQSKPSILAHMWKPIADGLFKLLRWRNSLRRLPDGLSMQDMELAYQFHEKLAIFLAAEARRLWENQYTVGFHDIAGFCSINDYGWETQILWSDLRHELRSISNGNTSAPFAITKPLSEIIGTLDGFCFIAPSMFDTPNDCGLGVNPEQYGWSSLLLLSKSSTAFIRELFSHKEAWIQHLATLWRHPNEDNILTTGLYQSLHPSMSLSVTEEYKRLIVEFLGAVFDSFDSADVIRYYEYPVKELRPLAQQLCGKDAKVFFSILFAVKLLTGDRSASTGDDTRDQSEEAYYINGILESIRALKTWSDIITPVSTPQRLTLAKFKEFMKNEDIVKANISCVYDREGNIYSVDDYLQQKVGETQRSLIIDVSYPFNDPNVQSTRALSILSLCLLCYVHYKNQVDTIRKALAVLILQIVEGLRDTSRRTAFTDLAGTQTKSRIDQWRKSRETKKRVVLRRLLDQEEERLVRTYVGLLQDLVQLDTILNALGLDERSEPRVRRKKDTGIFIL